MTEEKIVERVSGHGKNARFKITNYNGQGSEEEFLPRMNSEGKILGGISRSEAHKSPENIHAGVGIFIIDRQTEKIYLPKRASTKKKDPGCLDFSTGEHVKLDPDENKPRIGELETWNHAARRGLEEEMGLPPVSYSLLRIPCCVLDTNDPTETERRTFYIAQLTNGSQLLPDSREIDPSGGGWFKLSDLMEVVNGNTSEDNPLKGHQIRPMLLNDLKRPVVRGALEKFAGDQGTTS